ncbi:hypothetical protein [Conexibacter sp. CPCC 206217]|uniref:hypothetical protein n=1 Tax=Conexibacter sp. CPCC 206217 TaxID=3064574 RepID=UPI00271B8290|nr:hypothetical protein [Conexibacter sp. CPCC 206217]MDO8208975.1 hypothetical protein [Conexibacter sp. CPCC 206217]
MSIASLIVPSERALHARRRTMSAEHQHFTIPQQELRAADALHDVDAMAACDDLISDDPTGRLFARRALVAGTETERDAWLVLSTLEARSLKTPIMCALADQAESEQMHDRAGAVSWAVERSGVTVSANSIAKLLDRGPRRWQLGNELIADASDQLERRVRQVLRLANHEELLAARRAR